MSLVGWCSRIGTFDVDGFSDLVNAFVGFSDGVVDFCGGVRSVGVVTAMWWSCWRLFSEVQPKQCELVGAATKASPAKSY